MKLVTFCQLALLGSAYNIRDEENDIFMIVFDVINGMFYYIPDVILPTRKLFLKH